jgi:hypothetical protein
MTSRLGTGKSLTFYYSVQSSNSERRISGLKSVNLFLSYVKLDFTAHSLVEPLTEFGLMQLRTTLSIRDSSKVKKRITVCDTFHCIRPASSPNLFRAHKGPAKKYLTNKYCKHKIKSHEYVILYDFLAFYPGYSVGRAACLINLSKGALR